MKKTLITYLLIPGILLGAFIFFYLGAKKEMAEKAATQLAAKIEKDNAEKIRKAEIEKRALEDAEKRQREREASDKAKEDAKEAAYKSVMTQLANEATEYDEQANKLAKEAAALEISISQARTNKEKLNRDTFDLAKEVELAKVNRRNAEIEIQRMVEMAGRKMGTSSVAIPPPPPLPQAAK